MRVIRLALALLLALSLAANVVWLSRLWSEPARRSSTQSPPLDQYEVIRTKGGLLAVSAIREKPLREAPVVDTEPDEELVRA